MLILRTRDFNIFIKITVNKYLIVLLLSPLRKGFIAIIASAKPEAIY